MQGKHFQIWRQTKGVDKNVRLSTKNWPYLGTGVSSTLTEACRCRAASRFKSFLYVEGEGKLVFRQLIEFLDDHGLLPVHQSAYERRHSTETAIRKIVSNLLLACDDGQVTLLALLNLSTAFDTVDHAILLDRLQFAFGIRGGVFVWIKFFIINRSQTVK